ncbi:MAG TPA: hypothetical protein VE777_11855 [Gaiellales bacterium]|nr:hypothetical protein [Gaiellales bacterium]
MSAAARSLTAREVRAVSRSCRTGSGSAMTSWYQGRSPTGTSSSSPRRRRCQSAHEWWARTAALAGPVAQRLASLPDEATKALRARVRDAIGPYEGPGGLEFPGVALLASARAA